MKINKHRLYARFCCGTHHIACNESRCTVMKENKTRAGGAASARAAACSKTPHLTSSWSKLSRSRPERSAMDRLLLNLAVVASVIRACILAWAMPGSDGRVAGWTFTIGSGRRDASARRWSWAGVRERRCSWENISKHGLRLPSLFPQGSLQRRPERQGVNVWSADQPEAPSE